MKKGFTLIEIITALAVTSIILLFIASVTVFSSNIINKHNNQSETFDEVVLIEEVVRKFVENQAIVHVSSNEILNASDEGISFNKETNEVLVDGNVYLKLSKIKNMVFEKSESSSLIKLFLYLDDYNYYSFSYYK